MFTGTGTGSLVYEIKTDDVYEDCYEGKNLFDFSDYPRDSKSVNKNVIGKMKDELKGNITNEFVGLKSKIYSLIARSGREIRKAKEFDKNIAKSIRHEDLCDVLFNTKTMWKEFKRHNIKRIQSKLQRTGTYDICKTPLACFDDKKCIKNEDITIQRFEDIRGQ